VILSELAAMVERAGQRVYRHAIETPILPSTLGDGNRSVALKLECLQVTGSFKVRGAANKLEALSDHDGHRGVVACSSGNHGRAVAFVARRLGMTAFVFVPEWADPVKVEGMRHDGAQVQRIGGTYDGAEAAAIAFAKAEDLPFVSPFDDPEIIAGQGTIGAEILTQDRGTDTVLVPLSGGGLVAGVAAALKGAGSLIRVVAVSAERARVMYESVRAGNPVTVPEEPTLAGALAGGIGNPNRYTFDAVRDLVDHHVVVSETAIANAIRYLWSQHRLVVEGGGAVVVAALLDRAVNLGGRTLAVVSGANIDLDAWRQIIDSG
jgi:threonine dehydratase